MNPIHRVLEAAREVAECYNGPYAMKPDVAIWSRIERLQQALSALPDIAQGDVVVALSSQVAGLETAHDAALKRVCHVSKERDTLLAKLATARRDALEEAAKVCDVLANENENEAMAIPKGAPGSLPLWSMASGNRRCIDAIRALLSDPAKGVG